jgi:hypothetical protein
MDQHYTFIMFVAEIDQILQKYIARLQNWQILKL